MTFTLYNFWGVRTKKNCSPLNTDSNRKKLSRQPLSSYNDIWVFLYHTTISNLCYTVIVCIQLVRFSRVRDTSPSSFHMRDEPPGWAFIPRYLLWRLSSRVVLIPSHLYTDELKVPLQTQNQLNEALWVASSPFSSKGSPFHLLPVSVQTSREFCVAPKSLPPPDDESSLQDLKLSASTQWTSCKNKCDCIIRQMWFFHYSDFSYHTFSWNFVLAEISRVVFSLKLLHIVVSNILLWLLEKTLVFLKSTWYYIIFSNAFAALSCA